MEELQRINLKAPGCWINDPNGFIYFHGQYHLFYQCFPYGPRWGRMHWGHAVSKDLVTWEHLKIAIFPSKYDDMDGCFSGSSVEHNDELYLFYTGVRYIRHNPDDTNLCAENQFVSSQMLLVSPDGFQFDNINDKRTIIPPIKDTVIGGIRDTRDPKVWRGQDMWYMMVGSCTENEYGKLLFYKSENLLEWTFMNSVTKEGHWGRIWECPDYFEIGDNKVLLMSVVDLLEDTENDKSQSVCMLVDFDESHCQMRIPDNYQFFDYGFDLYAPQTTMDENGNRTVIAWARMPEAVEQSWSGIFCIPRVIEIKEKHIYFLPHPNVRKAYTRECTEVFNRPDIPFRIELLMHEGDEVCVGGYRIFREGNCICTDRSSVFYDLKEYSKYFKTPELTNEVDEVAVEIYVNPNLIEVYVNDGEYVISNVVYELGEKMIYNLSKSALVYTVNRNKL